MSTKAFLIDVEKCTGCNLCIIACKDEHCGSTYAPWTKPQPNVGHFWVAVRAMERGRIPRVRMTYLPLLCQHCGNAACIKACPENAIKRRPDGLVWIDPAMCTGCGLCQPACPYDVIYMNADLNIAQKCTGCAHRADQGALPRCAEICPHDAIVFGDETGDAFKTSMGTLEVYRPEYQAQPRVYWRGLPKPWIAGTVIDAVSDEVIVAATITLVDLLGDTSVTGQSDEFGDFWIRDLENNGRYKVKIGKDGYEDFFSIATTDGDQDLGNVSLQRVG